MNKIVPTIAVLTAVTGFLFIGTSVYAQTFIRPLTIGSKGDDVSALQEILTREGFFTYGTVTGYFGPVTAAALSKFQAARNLEPVGSVGPLTRALLNNSSASGLTNPTPTTAGAGASSASVASSSVEELTQSLALGTRSEQVALLQRVLRDAGFFTFPEITTYFGPATQQALMAFQRQNGLEAVGSVGPRTRALINAKFHAAGGGAGKAPAAGTSQASGATGAGVGTKTQTQGQSQSPGSNNIYMYTGGGVAGNGGADGGFTRGFVAGDDVDHTFADRVQNDVAQQAQVQTPDPDIVVTQGNVPTVVLPNDATVANIQQAVNLLTSGGKVVLPQDKIFYVTKAILVDVTSRNIEIDLNGSVLKLAVNDNLISAFGSHAPISQVVLSKNGFGQVVVTYPTAQTDLKAGDWVKVFSDDVLPGGHPDAGLPPRLGQAMQVASVSGTTVTFSNELVYYDLYKTNIRASKYISGTFTLRNGTLIGDQSQPDWKWQLVKIKSVLNPVVEKIYAKDSNSMGISLQDTVNARITDIVVKNLRDDPVNGYYGEAVHSYSGYQTTVRGLYGEKVRHTSDNNTNGIAAGNPFVFRYGGDIRMDVRNSIAHNNSAAAWDWHSECVNCRIENVLAFGSYTVLGGRGIGGVAKDISGVGNQRGIEFLEWGVGDSRNITVENMMLKENSAYHAGARGNSYPGTTGPQGNVLLNSYFEQFPYIYYVDPKYVTYTNTQVVQLTVKSNLNDTTTGTSADNTLLGGTGNDTLSGLGGNDYLMGGAGTDTLMGGPGRDRFAYHASSEAADSITDFASDDFIDLSVLAIRNEWLPGNPFTRGYVQVIQSGSDAVVKVSPTGNGTYETLTTLLNFNANSFTADHILLTINPNLAGGPVGTYPIVSNVPMGSIPQTPPPQNQVENVNNNQNMATATPPQVQATPLTINGDAADNFISGAALGDTLNGNDGNDIIKGMAGNDTMNGGNGADTLYGGDDDDTMWGEAGDDKVYGENGNDTLIGGTGKNTLVGSFGNDNFVFDGLEADYDTLSDFTPGSDKLVLLASAFGISSSPTGLYNQVGSKFNFWIDLAAGGQGLLAYDNVSGWLTWNPTPSNAATSVHFGNTTGALTFAPTDIIVTNSMSIGASTASFAPGSGAAVATSTPPGGGATTTPGTTINGDANDNVLTGGTGADTIRAKDGNDTLNGAEGDDKLYGENGDDRLVGGPGKDQYTGGAGADKFYFTHNDGVYDSVFDHTVGVDSLVMYTPAFNMASSPNVTMSQSGSTYTFTIDLASGGTGNLVYNSVSGWLTWNGVHFGSLTASLTPSVSDFSFVSALP